MGRKKEAKKALALLDGVALPLEQVRVALRKVEGISSCGTGRVIRQELEKAEEALLRATAAAMGYREGLTHRTNKAINDLLSEDFDIPPFQMVEIPLEGLEDLMKDLFGGPKDPAPTVSEATERLEKWAGETSKGEPEGGDL